MLPSWSSLIRIAEAYPLKHCAKGMYIVQFRAEGHLATQKVVL